MNGYAYGNGVSWYIEIVDAQGYVLSHTSIALDINGYPLISYYDEAQDDLRYARKDDQGWDFATVDSEGSVSLHTALAVDDEGNPHIS